MPSCMTRFLESKREIRRLNLHWNRQAHGELGTWAQQNSSITHEFGWILTRGAPPSLRFALVTHCRVRMS